MEMQSVAPRKFDHNLDLLMGLEHQYGVSLSHDDDDDDDDGVVVREQCWDLD